MSSANCGLVIFLPPMLTFPPCFFQSISHNLFEKHVEEGGREKAFLPNSNCYSEPFSCAVVHLNCTCSLVLSGVN